MAALPFACHSTMVPHFQGSPRFPQKHSPRQRSSLPSLQAISTQPTAVLSPGPLSKPHTSTPRPCQHRQTPISGWGVQDCGPDHLCKSCSVLPATDGPLHFLLIAPEAPPLFQHILPLVGGLPGCNPPGLLLSSPSPIHQGCRSQPISSFLFLPFLSFVLPSYAGIFSCPFRCPRS